MMIIISFDTSNINRINFTDKLVFFFAVGFSIFDPYLFELQLGTLLHLLATIYLSLFKISQQLNLSQIIPRYLYGLMYIFLIFRI